jgi:diguanylate cyclase (GGDEF)-like protein
MACAAALVLLIAGWTLSRHEPPSVAHLVLYAGLVVGGELFIVSARFGSHQIRFGWGEAALLVGLVLLPAPWLIVCAACAISVTQLSRGFPPAKIVLNGAATTLGAALATTVASLGGAATPLHVGTVRGAVAAVAAALTFAVVMDLAVSAAVAFSQDMPFRAVAFGGFGQKLAVSAGNIGAALVALAIFHLDHWVLLSVPPILYALHFAYEHRLRAQNERTMWEQLGAATRALVRLDEQEVVRNAIHGASELFRPDDVEVVVYRPDGSRLEIGREADGQAPGPAAEVVLRTPLEDGETVIGELRLCFRGTVTLSDRERATLDTFASALSAALNNARLHETTRALADNKAYEAGHDSLTGLSNRAALFEHGDLALAGAADKGQFVALLLLDLDHFKEINDTLGHEAGDQLLQAVAARLGASVRRGDTAARLGGDEFALLLTGIRNPQTATTIAGDLLRDLGAPVVVDGLRLPVEGSIGVACAPTDAMNMRELLRCADVAMYQAKETGACVERYDAGRDGGNVDRLIMIDELRNALDAGQLLLHFQPKIELRTGKAMGAEALVRWQHPRRGLLRPAEFMSVVEHSGLVRQFTLHVVRLALAACAEWARQGPAMPVAVNLSTRNLLDPDLPRDVKALLEQYGVPGERLVLEITETVAMSELDVVETVLGELRDLGARLSVDDFGTGYSSLTFLSRVTVHEVKVDGSFVSTMIESPGNAAIVRATTELAHAFGLRVIAEGVECEEHYRALAQLGCDGAQGYFLGAPVPADEIRTALDTQFAPVTAVPGNVVPLRLA